MSHFHDIVMDILRQERDLHGGNMKLNFEKYQNLGSHFEK